MKPMAKPEVTIAKNSVHLNCLPSSARTSLSAGKFLRPFPRSARETAAEAASKFAGLKSRGLNSV